MQESLKVILWGKEVGRLAWDRRRRRTYFTYNPAFLNGRLDVSPLVASVKNVQSRMPIWAGSDNKYQRLPPFLADSLPDDWGNRLFEYWRTENRLSNADITPLEKLSFIGTRGMGALEFEPEVSRGGVHDTIDVQSLVELARRISAERENVSIRPDESLTIQSLIAVGTSAGGRQPKAIVAIHRETGEIKSGQVGGLDGYDYCILKFGDAARSTAEIEMTYYDMACRAGIRMMPSRLLDVEGQKHFLTKRFDRDGEEKLHTQTLAAIYPGADSYEKLLWVCRKMRLSERDCEEVFRRMVFNLIANNTDDHDKNFSFVMDSSGHWSLSPAYDLTFIFNIGGYQPQDYRCLMIRGKLSAITKQDVLDFARDNGIRRANTIIREVTSAIFSFRELATKYGVADEWTSRINTCLTRHLVEWGFAQVDIRQDDTFESSGHKVENARIEQAYRGNFHLLATIDGRELKYIFRQGTDEYNQISHSGIDGISRENLRELITRHLIPKIHPL